MHWYARVNVMLGSRNYLVRQFSVSVPQGFCALDARAVP